MINNERVIALIPLRGGSKGVKHKNLKDLGGKPLLAWPIEVALQTKEIDRVIISTDDEQIAAAARRYGAEVYTRPAPLATDTALVIDTIRYMKTVLREEGETADIMLLLEATSPFRTPDLIRRCLKKMIQADLDSVATFHEAELNPHRAWTVDPDPSKPPRPFIPGAIPWAPRQSLPPAYQVNGAVYAFRLQGLPEDSPSLLYGNMGAEILDNSVIDIDDEEDFKIANAILQL